MGTDRLCIVEIADDGNDDMLHFVVRTDGRTLEFDLTDELQEGLAIEGWEFLADFEPDLFRHGAAERWRAIAHLEPSEQAT
ncbi:MAG: hypothetical protein KDD78_08265 [Caldilineaceae bacterium]|nr:hypothetical protein [Caldilineaceae bacterium]